MAAITPIPHTRIENSIIDNIAQINVYGYAVYCAIKRHLNQKTGDCYPSYATIARKIGIDRGTVIRYVKKLKTLNLISPLLRFKEDGSPTSNQYNFHGTDTHGGELCIIFCTIFCGGQVNPNFADAYPREMMQDLPTHV